MKCEKCKGTGWQKGRNYFYCESCFGTSKEPEQQYTSDEKCPECGCKHNYTMEEYAQSGATDYGLIPHKIDSEDGKAWRVCEYCHQEWFTNIYYNPHKEISSDEIREAFEREYPLPDHITWRTKQYTHMVETLRTPRYRQFFGKMDGHGLFYDSGCSERLMSKLKIYTTATQKAQAEIEELNKYTVTCEDSLIKQSFEITNLKSRIKKLEQQIEEMK